MPNPNLEQYIKVAREQKISDLDIKTQLVKTGWPDSEIDQALNPKTSPSLPMSPPPIPQFGMWVAFQYVIFFIALYVSATSLGGLVHHMVDTYIIDAVNTINRYSGGFNDFMLKGYIAALIVSFPIFAYLFLVLKRLTIKNHAVKNLKARKLLIYITMVGTFIIMLIHLISTIFNFLDGRTTMNSLAHLGVTFIIAGSIFGYLLHEIQEDRKS